MAFIGSTIRFARSIVEKEDRFQGCDAGPNAADKVEIAILASGKRTPTLASLSPGSHARLAVRSPGPGDARLARQIGRCLIGVLVELIAADGLRSYDAHVAAQHVEELRQF